MFSFEKLAIISDLKTLQEEKKKLNNKLYSLRWSIQGKETSDELKQEAIYLKDLSIIDEKIKIKELEIKKTAKIKAIIFVLVFTTFFTSLSFFKKCSYIENSNKETKNYNFSIEKDKYILKKTVY